MPRNRAFEDTIQDVCHSCEFIMTPVIFEANLLCFERNQIKKPSPTACLWKALLSLQNDPIELYNHGRHAAGYLRVRAASVGVGFRRDRTHTLRFRSRG